MNPFIYDFIYPLCCTTVSHIQNYYDPIFVHEMFKNIKQLELYDIHYKSDSGMIKPPHDELPLISTILKKIYTNVDTIVFNAPELNFNSSEEIIPLLSAFIKDIKRLDIINYRLSGGCYLQLANMIYSSHIQFLYLTNVYIEALKYIILHYLVKSNIIGLHIECFVVDKDLMDAIFQIPKLQYLVIKSENSILDDAIIVLKNKLKLNPPLKELYINTVHIISKLFDFEDTFDHNTNLKVFDIGHSNITFNTKQTINAFKNNVGITHLNAGNLWKTAEMDKFLIDRPFICFHQLLNSSYSGDIIIDALTNMHFLIRVIHFIICKAYKLPHFIKLFICFDTYFTELENIALTNYFLENVNTNMSLETAWSQLLQIKLQLRKQANILKN